MKVRLLSVGRPRDREAGALHDRYARRIEQLGVRYEAEWVAEVKAGGRYSDEHVREREAVSLLERLRRGEVVVSLDRSGQMASSVELARRLEGWIGRGVTLILGGPLGLHRRIPERADWCWSLSALTLPHELARVWVAEQVYRALTIHKGLPYHK